MNNNQRDPRWANIPVGFGEQTIGQVGCTLSTIGDILGITPDIVNEKLKAVNGFANSNLVIWAKIEEAFPGVKIKRVWEYNNDEVLANIPNVIVEVTAMPIGGRGRHWVNYIGNQQLKDPWTGQIRPTSDFPNPMGYCIIIPPSITNSQEISNSKNQEVTFFPQDTIKGIYLGILGIDPTKDEIEFRLSQLATGTPYHDIVSQVLNLDSRSPLISLKNQVNQLEDELKKLRFKAYVAAPPVTSQNPLKTAEITDDEKKTLFDDGGTRLIGWIISKIKLWKKT